MPHRIHNKAIKLGRKKHGFRSQAHDYSHAFSAGYGGRYWAVRFCSFAN